MGTSSSSGLCVKFSFFLREQWCHPATESNPELGHSHWYELVPESLETGLSLEANSKCVIRPSMAWEVTIVT